MLKDFLFTKNGQLQQQAVLMVGPLDTIFTEVEKTGQILIKDGHLHLADYYLVKEPIAVEDFKKLLTGVWRRPLGAIRLIVLDGRYLNVFVQNSLLKVLEEPPANNCFILLSDKTDRWLETVKSRCRLINFSSTFDFLKTTSNQFWVDFWNQDAAGREKIFTQLLKKGESGWENDFLQSAEHYLKQLIENGRLNKNIAVQVKKALVNANRQSTGGIWRNRRLLLEPIWLSLFEN